MINYIITILFLVLSSCNGKNDNNQGSASPNSDLDKPEQPQIKPTEPPLPPPRVELEPKKFVNYDKSSLLEPLIDNLFPKDCPLDNDLVTFFIFNFHSRQDDNDIKTQLKNMKKDIGEKRTPYFIAIISSALKANLDEARLNNLVQDITGKEAILPKDPNHKRALHIIVRPIGLTSIGSELVEPEIAISNIRIICEEIRALQKQNISKEVFKEKLANTMLNKLTKTKIH